MTLDEAWAEVEAALPDRWRLTGLQSAGFWPRWYASAMAAITSPDETCDHGQVHRGSREYASVIGDTPALALQGLAAKLREAVGLPLPAAGSQPAGAEAHRGA